MNEKTVNISKEELAKILLNNIQNVPPNLEPVKKHQLRTFGKSYKLKKGWLVGWGERDGEISVIREGNKHPTTWCRKFWKPVVKPLIPSQE